jgi:hypothetical protein
MASPTSLPAGRRRRVRSDVPGLHEHCEAEFVCLPEVQLIRWAWQAERGDKRGEEGSARTERFTERCEAAPRLRAEVRVEVVDSLERDPAPLESQADEVQIDPGRRIRIDEPRPGDVRGTEGAVVRIEES